MALSRGMNQEASQDTDLGLLDATLMQNLQDRFCDANNVYLVCLSRTRGVVTKAYGSKEELAYIHGLTGVERHMTLMNRLLDDGIESVLEEDCGNDLVKMCGVSIKIGGKTAAIWIVIGIMDREGGDVPSYVMRTTPERYDKSLEFLETLSKQMFAVKMEELMAQEAVLKSRESETQMEAELHRNEVMTSIVKMLESENSFEEIVHDILRECCAYMEISRGALLKENKEHSKIEMICEYAAPGMDSVRGEWSGVSREKMPFFNGKPYMISSNSMMPEVFRQFFDAHGLLAGIFLPVEVNTRAEMYLCFLEEHEERNWEVTDVKFVNDVRRIIQSILLKRIAKNSLASSYASLEAILENVGCGIYVKDPVSGRILYSNQRLRAFLPDDAAPDMLENCWREESGGIDTDCFHEIYLEQEKRWFDYHRTGIHWVDGRSVFLYTIYEVTDKKLYQQKIERQANNDFLTGLYNRMRFEQDLAHCIEQTKEFGGEGALLYIDLDDFKHINDGLGHQYGDILLKNISDSLRRIPGVENNCYRMGGDEFIIILAHRQIMMLQKILNDIRTLFSKPWMLKGADYYCTMSMGVVRFPTEGDTVEELIKKADIALYAAKCSGKNRVEFYDENVESTSFRRLDMEKNMRNATNNAFSEFEVVYQPIVDVTRESNPCVGAEALIRWNSGELGLIAPTDFIPLAEYLGLINPIGAYVLEEACKRCKYWNDMGHPDYKVNVNLSVVQLLQNDIVEQVRSVIKRTGIVPENFFE